MSKFELVNQPINLIVAVGWRRSRNRESGTFDYCELVGSPCVNGLGRARDNKNGRTHALLHTKLLVNSNTQAYLQNVQWSQLNFDTAGRL